MSRRKPRPRRKTAAPSASPAVVRNAPSIAARSPASPPARTSARAAVAVPAKRRRSLPTKRAAAPAVAARRVRPGESSNSRRSQPGTHHERGDELWAHNARSRLLVLLLDVAQASKCPQDGLGRSRFGTRVGSGVRRYAGEPFDDMSAQTTRHIGVFLNQVSAFVWIDG